MSIKLVDGGQTLKVTANWPTSRSKVLWPFASDSHMNQSIGEDAVYIDAQLGVQDDNVAVDLQIFSANHENVLTPSSSDPLYPFYVGNNGGGPFPPGPDRCTGTVPVEDVSTGLDAGPVRFPTNLVISGDGITVGDTTTTDASGSFTLPDDNNDFYYSSGGLVRCVADGPVYGAPTVNKRSLKGSAYDGVFAGTYGGAKIWLRGLTVKTEDILRTDDWIPHPCALWLRPYMYYMNRVTQTAEWRWPALLSDATFDKYPTTTGLSPNWEPFNLKSSFIPGLTQGCLLAIPKSETPNSVGIQTELGLKYFNMFQDYGGYTVNESGSDPLTYRCTMATQPEAHQAVIDTYGHPLSYVSLFATNPNYPPAGSDWRRWMEDLMAIWSKLHIVDDNAANNIGGAGTLRFRPAAPPFSD